MEQEEAQADGLNLVPILLCVNAHHHQAANPFCEKPKFDGGGSGAW
jgi:hypothetical protein